MSEAANANKQKKKINREDLSPENMPYKCFKCGACCMSLHRDPSLAEFDALLDDDESCMYFDKERHLCRIYADRPIACSVEDTFHKMQAEGKDITWYDFVQFNMASCVLLRQSLGIPEPEGSPFAGKEQKAIDFVMRNVEKFS